MSQQGPPVPQKTAQSTPITSAGLHVTNSPHRHPLPGDSQIHGDLRHKEDSNHRRRRSSGITSSRPDPASKNIDDGRHVHAHSHRPSPVEGHDTHKHPHHRPRESTSPALGDANANHDRAPTHARSPTLIEDHRHHSAHRAHSADTSLQHHIQSVTTHHQTGGSSAPSPAAHSRSAPESPNISPPPTQVQQHSDMPLSHKLLHALRKKPTLARTWEKRSYLEAMRSAPGGSADDTELAEVIGSPVPRPSSFYASPADIASFRPLPSLSAPSAAGHSP